VERAKKEEIGREGEKRREGEREEREREKGRERCTEILSNLYQSG
jgi:hypothetical protein